MKKELSKKIKALCFVLRGNEILLGMKKRGFGEGKWNGFGGKVEGDETIEEAIKRELLEEASLQINNFADRGTIIFKGNDLWDIVEVHVFRCTNFEGEPKESDEMKPKWFNQNNIPYNQMLPDDKYWLPLLLKGKKFKAKFIYNDKGEILSQQVTKI